MFLVVLVLLVLVSRCPCTINWRVLIRNLLIQGIKRDKLLFTMTDAGRQELVNANKKEQIKLRLFLLV